MDSFSPLATARVLVQVLPVGPIAADVFEKILKNLTEVGVLTLNELQAPEEPDRSTSHSSGLGYLSFAKPLRYL